MMDGTGMSAQRSASRKAARAAGGLAVAVSVVVAASLPIRDVDLNAANLWTLMLGAIGGVLAFAARSKGWLVGAAICIFSAAVPALVGWVGWLYLPSIGLLVLSLVRSEE